MKPIWVFLAVVVSNLSFGLAQEQFVTDDDALDAAASGPQPNEPEPQYPDGVNTIPGVAERDYPTYTNIWKTSFSCLERPPGFYGDVEARCQIWYICDERGQQQSFICSNGTIFSQSTRVCDWWYNVNCDLKEVESNYRLNDDLFQIPERWEEGKQNNNNNGESNKPVQLIQNPERYQVNNKNSPRPNEFQQQQPQSHRSRDFPPPPPPPAIPSNYIQGQGRGGQRTAAAPVAIARLDRTQIAAALAASDEANKHLSDEERFPLKYKLRRQREMEAIRLKKLEEARQQEAQQQQPQQLPVRQQQQQKSFQQHYQEPKSFQQQQYQEPKPYQQQQTPKPFQQPQQQYQTTKKPYQQPQQQYTTSKKPYQPPQQQYTTTKTTQKPYVRPETPTPLRVVEVDQNENKPAIIRLSNNFGVNPPQQPVYRPNAGNNQPPTTTTTPRPTTRSNIYKIRPNPQVQESNSVREFEGTDESKFPQQQARQFPTFTPSRPITLQDPVNSQETRNTANNANPRFQNIAPKQEQRRPDVNADGNRFQNGETRQRSQNQQRGENRQQVQERRPQNTETRPQPNRFQNEGQSERGQNLFPEQKPQQRPQQQSRKQDNFRQQEEPVHVPTQSRSRTRSDQENRRPSQDAPRQEEPRQEIRRPVQEEPRGPPPPVDSPPRQQQFAAPESHRKKFRHSTPRRHNVQFAPAARSNRDTIDEVSEETINHPIPSPYNNRFPIPAYHQQQLQPSRQHIPRIFQTTTTTSTTTTPEPPTRPTRPSNSRTSTSRVLSHRPTPGPETVHQIHPLVFAKDKPRGGVSSPTIVRIIVKQKVKSTPEPPFQKRRSSSSSAEDSLDVREEEDFFQREVVRGFGGRYRS